MLKPGAATVWRARLDSIAADSLPPLLPEEAERAARFHSDEVRQRYIRSHGVLRAVLERAGLPTVFARDDRGKPWLPDLPDAHFNLARSHGMALVAVARGAAVGVDVERYRTLPEYMAIAERFMPASLYAGFLEVEPAEREREFLRLWTRTEAALKALGVGLYGAGEELSGPWTIAGVDAGPGFAAAVAVRAEGFRIQVLDFA